MAKICFYKTVEEITEAIDKFSAENKVYTEKELAKALGFMSKISLISTKRRKGFEHIFDNCRFIKEKRENFITERKSDVKMSDASDIKKYADSIQPEIEAYCKARRTIRLIREGKL